MDLNESGMLLPSFVTARGQPALHAPDKLVTRK